MIRILLTRPLAQSQRFAAALGPEFDVLSAPLMQIAFRDGPAQTGPAQALVFTSLNGVAGWVRRAGPTTLPAWCVGTQTAQAARQAGFSVQGHAATVAQLAQSITDAVIGPVLHVRGAHVSADLHMLLPQIAVSDCIVYDAVTQPLSPAARVALAQGAVDVIPVFSARSARCLVDAWDCDWPVQNIRFLAISSTTADVLRTLPGIAVETSIAPNGVSMLALLRCKSAQC